MAFVRWVDASPVDGSMVVLAGVTMLCVLLGAGLQAWYRRSRSTKKRNGWQEQ